MFTIIQAKPSFLTDIYTLIMELAKYEGIEEKIKITEDELGELLFQSHPRHFVRMALDQDKLVGFVMFNYAYHNVCVNVSPGIYIENLYVSPDYRKQGIGRSLFRHVAWQSRKDGCSRIEWWVLKDNHEAKAFYKKMQAIGLSSWDIYKCDETGIDRLLESGDL